MHFLLPPQVTALARLHTLFLKSSTKSGGGGVGCHKKEGCSLEILKRTSQEVPRPCFVGVLEICSLLRGANFKTTHYLLPYL